MYSNKKPKVASKSTSPAKTLKTLTAVAVIAVSCLLPLPQVSVVTVMASESGSLPIPGRTFGAYPRSRDIHIDERPASTRNNTGTAIHMAPGVTAPNNTTATSNATAANRHHLSPASASPLTPSPYNQGDYIGTIHIHRLNRRIRIFEGETMRNMDFGGGRFTFTGLDSGNIGLIGHNRGSNGYFSFVRLLQEGDLITFYTNNTTRQYQVTTSYIVHETNWQLLEQTGDNRLSLVTCVEYRPRYRRIAVAVRV